ncbi:MAG: PIN domain-containing protein [Coriobacteriia bacterium]|nr:PIN domain-containing protein [Coriobacteriia bacterium]
MKIFVDTNVYLDLIANRPEFVEGARLLCMAASFDDLELWISTQSVTDADYILRGPGVRDQARRAMASSLRLFRLCGTHALDCEKALTDGWPDVEDCLIAHSAKRIGADAIVTRDIKGFERSSIPAYSPTQLMELLRTEHGLEYESISW